MGSARIAPPFLPVLFNDRDKRGPGPPLPCTPPRFFPVLATDRDKRGVFKPSPRSEAQTGTSKEEANDDGDKAARLPERLFFTKSFIINDRRLTSIGNFSTTSGG